MTRTSSIALATLLLLATAPLLGACHTTEGAGEDVSDVGHAVAHDARAVTP
jgi:predicted small secreted protein